LWFDFVLVFTNTKPAAANLIRGNRLSVWRLPFPDDRDRPLRAFFFSYSLHDPLILTMQGLGQHEPLIRLDLHFGSCSCPRASQWARVG
jgi:hypothetical protein